jgi:DNA-directed RNA polymerase subunit RPC12/RpoP
MRKAIFVPVRCVNCGKILDYMDINSSEYEMEGSKVLKCPICGVGVRFTLRKLR